MTNYATRFINNQEVALLIVQYNFDGFGRDWRFVPMHNIPTNITNKSRVGVDIMCSLYTITIPHYCTWPCDVTIDCGHARFKSISLRNE